MNKILFIVFLVPLIINAQTGSDELINPKELIHDLVVDLRYGTPDHKFLNLPNGDIQLPKFYTCNESLMLLQLAESLKLAQDSLRNIREYDGRIFPKGIGIKIWDAYRPRAVQYLLFEIFPNPTYVADPASGSMHNRGGAVDLTLVDLETGKELEMPTLFDDFSQKSAHTYNDLAPHVIANRKLLRDVMTNIAKLSIYSSEWWHYNLSGASSFPLRDFQMK